MQAVKTGRNPITCGIRYALGVGIAAASLLMGGSKNKPDKPADLFQLTGVRTVHLTFTGDQWDAMEPRSGAGPGGPGQGPLGPGGGRPPMPADRMLPGFLSADKDSNGRISAEEFRNLGETWFAAWRKTAADELTSDEVKAGISAAFKLQPFPGPEAAGRGPGRGLLGMEGKRNGMSAASGIDFEYVHADLEFDGQRFSDVAVRYKGNNSFMMARNSIKRSLKLDLNQFTKGQKLAGKTTLNLHNNVTDASSMNEPLSYSLFREAGVPSPRTSYARVYITIPGRYERKYFGLYSLVENIDKHFLEDRALPKGGAIFKPVGRDLFGYLGEDWARYNQMYDPKTDLSKAQKDRVIEFARLVTNASDAEFSSKLESFLDLDEFARFMAVTVWLSNSDSILGMGQNFYVYLDAKTNQFQFLPWDLDHSFGQFPMAGGQSDQLSIRKPWQGTNRFLERVFKVEAFHKRYLARMAEFNSSLFEPKRIAGQVDEIAKIIRPAVVEESDSLLARFDSAVAGKSVNPREFAGEDRQPGPRGAMFGAKPIKAFVPPRNQSVANQLLGKSQGSSESERPGPRGPGGPGGFGPDTMIQSFVMRGTDLNRDGKVARDELKRGFSGWMEAWDTNGDATLTREEIRAGLNSGFSDLMRRGPGGSEFGPSGPRF